MILGDRVAEQRTSFFDSLGETLVTPVGHFMMFLGEIIKHLMTPPLRIGLILRHIDFIGHQSLSIIGLTGFFTGGVFGLQIAGIFVIFRAESMVGGATGIALARELAPLMTGFILAGRAGSAMAAELATMKVNEQILAMEAMAVDPVHYLVVPRVLASMFAMPLLCGVFMLAGMVGAYTTGVTIFEVDPGVFIEKLVEMVGIEDVFSGLFKMLFFSMTISIIACQFGLKASGGAKGVGVATTTAVVRILLVLLCVDFIVSYVQIRWF